MGYINQILTPDPDTFPGAIFEAAGNVPEAQCQESQIVSVAGTSTTGTGILTEVGKFVGIDLAGKKCDVTLPALDVGTYDIISNDDDALLLDYSFAGPPGGVNYTCEDAGQAYLTRNLNSLARFIHDAGFAYTIKGGKLYTDCPNLTLADACSDTWDPGE